MGASLKNEKNIYWINAVKAFSILGVYLIHVQADTFYGYSIGNVQSFIDPWYVNAFFFISGYLLFRKQLSEPLINEDKVQYLSRSEGGQKSLLLMFSSELFYLQLSLQLLNMFQIV